MNGPFDNIPYDAGISTMIDWEAELAVVIGKKGKNISEENAMDYVFGYSAYNDTTARDVQQKRHSGQWFKGKSLDGHGPMGPWVVTAGGVNLDDTRIICRVMVLRNKTPVTSRCTSRFRSLFLSCHVVLLCCLATSSRLAHHLGLAQAELLRSL